MTATAIVTENSKPSAKHTPRPSEKPAAPQADRTESSVYAAYWQERSGFFNAESELSQRPSTR